MSKCGSIWVLLASAGWCSVAPQRGPLRRRVVVSRESGCLDGWWGTIRDIYSEDREGTRYDALIIIRHRQGRAWAPALAGAPAWRGPLARLHGRPSQACASQACASSYLQHKQGQRRYRRKMDPGPGGRQPDRRWRASRWRRRRYSRPANIPARNRRTDAGRRQRPWIRAKRGVPCP